MLSKNGIALKVVKGGGVGCDKEHVCFLNSTMKFFIKCGYKLFATLLSLSSFVLTSNRPNEEVASNGHDVCLARVPVISGCHDSVYGSFRITSNIKVHCYNISS